MMRPQSLIALADVEAGSRRFQGVLGHASGHGGSGYEMLLLNPNSRQREVWLRGPEGYVVVIAGRGS